MSISEQLQAIAISGPPSSLSRDLDAYREACRQAVLQGGAWPSPPANLVKFLERAR